MFKTFARVILRYAMVIILSGVSMMAYAEQMVLPIWPGAAPGSETWTQKEVTYQNPQKEAMVRNVVRPTLTAFLPERSKANGTAVIVCPGGGFRFLASTASRPGRQTPFDGAAVLDRERDCQPPRGQSRVSATGRLRPGS